MNSKLDSVKADAIAGDALATPMSRTAGPREALRQALQSNSALGLILVKASALEPIEARYGVAAHDQGMERLREIVADVCAKHMGDADLIESGTYQPDEVAVFFSRPRSEDRFYCATLAEIRQQLNERLGVDGHKVVYPYLRTSPLFAVGKPRSFTTPGSAATDNFSISSAGRAKTRCSTNPSRRANAIGPSKSWCSRRMSRSSTSRS